MRLTPRAISYLSSLLRHDPLSTEEVADALDRAGSPRFDAWLEFHSMFGGYEEVIGLERAVWGIAHADSFWVDPYEAAVERNGSRWRVFCAAVHPSYDYWLYSDGEFRSSGGLYESFATKVERDALFWQACMGNRSWTLEAQLHGSAPEITALCASLGMRFSSESSDKYSACYESGDTILVQRDTDADVWAPRDGRERVASQIRDLWPVPPA